MCCGVALPLCLEASQAPQAAGAQTLVVLPFENESSAPGLEWISEAFPEVLNARMSVPLLYVIGRDDRLYAFDRSGIPTNVHLSRATMFRIAEQMDADYVVLGRYRFDGQTFTGVAQILDMKRLRLLPEMSESGPLTSLIEIQRSLAWDLLKQLHPDFPPTKADFLASAPTVRLDAFEKFIRGVMSGTRQERVQRFRETLHLNPAYTPAMLELAKTYFANREYESAASWFARIPKTDPAANEASFHLGLSAFYLGDYARAEEAFTFLSQRLPLTEVYNDLGVVAGRRGKHTELEYFQKATETDPKDPDYHFNLGVALYRAGDAAGALRQLRETLALKPTDVEAKTLLDTLTAKPGVPRLNGKLPLTRIKINYDETSFQQLALEIKNLTEVRLAKTDPKTHAAYHVERGAQLLEQGFNSEALVELREATTLDSSNATAYMELARALENTSDAAGARDAAEAALRLKPSADAFLVLGRLDLKDNNLEAAAHKAEQALAAEPANARALAFKQEVASRLAGKERTP